MQGTFEIQIANLKFQIPNSLFISTCRHCWSLFGCVLVWSVTFPGVECRVLACPHMQSFMFMAWHFLGCICRHGTSGLDSGAVEHPEVDSGVLTCPGLASGILPPPGLDSGILPLPFSNEATAQLWWNINIFHEAVRRRCSKYGPFSSWGKQKHLAQKRQHLTQSSAVECFQ